MRTIPQGLRSGSIIFGKNPTCQPTVNLSQFISRQVPCRPDSYSKQEPSVKTLLPEIKMMGSPVRLTVFFCSVKSTITVRQSKSLEDQEIGKQFSHLWRVLAEQLKILFLDGDDEGAFTVLALDALSQILSIKDRRNGIGKPVFKLFLEVVSCLLLLHLTCVFLEFLMKCCKGSSLNQHGHCVMAALPPHRFSAAWWSRRLFLRFPLPMGFTIFALFGSLLDLTGCSTLLQEKFSVRLRSPARPPCRAFSSLPLCFGKVNQY